MRNPIGIIMGGVIAVAVLIFGFVWTTCRVYVPEGQMAIVTTKTGKELPPGRILAEPGEKGVQRVPLAEGRHFLNPINNDWTIVSATTIPAGKVGIVTSKTGKELPPGEIIAPDDDYKGVWRRVLGPGTYRLNPEGYEIEVKDAINIPIGYAGVVTSLTGKPAPEGKFAGPGEKGVFEKILQPGLYYVNTRAYQVDVVEIGMNQVSIVGKSGTVVLTKAQSTSANGLAELQQNTLSSQIAKRADYMNANADLGILNAQEAQMNLSHPPVGSSAARKKVAPRKTASVQQQGGRQHGYGAPMPAAAKPPVQTSDSVAFGMNQFVQFPSSDGFAIMLDMTVEFELLPENISRIYMLYGDLPAVVSKIILPQILSVSRMKGSGYKAREFIDGEGRQKFQEEMTRELVSVLGEKHILVRNAIVRHVEVPADILAPMQAASESKEQDLTNRTRQETAKKQALLNTEVALVAQLRREVEQETEKLVATIGAETRRAVATTNAATKVRVAQIGLERAKVEAQAAKVKGEAAVQAEFLVANEEALGEQRRAAVFRDPATLADLAFADSLPEKLSVRVLHAGEGTLWTDLKAPPLALPAQ